jgi:predicted nucleic acid-binding protein
VVIDMERIDPADLPVEIAISAITLAELAAGPHATADSAERARRQGGRDDNVRPRSHEAHEGTRRFLPSKKIFVRFRGLRDFVV